MSETVTIRKKTYEKCTPEEHEILDIQHDNDEYGWASEKEYITPIEASLYKIGELLNQVLAPLLPDDMEITVNRNGITIVDHEHCIERYYNLYKTEPTTAEYSITNAMNQFELLVAEAQRKMIEEKTVLTRGEWHQIPDQKYNRYNMLFKNGGTVPCGLQDGRDNIPAIVNTEDVLLGLGEYVWSRPAIAALDKDYDLVKGTEILDLIHDKLRLKAGRDEAYRRTYGR